MPIPVCAPADPCPEPPSFAMPAGAVDTHFHVFGPADVYPYASDRAYTPPDAPVAAYRQLAARLGIQRAVIIQPSVYLFDNRRTLDAMGELGMPARAVAVVDPAVSDAELARLHGLGVRGLRVNLIFGGQLDFGDARRLADRIRPLGWHLQFLADVSAIPDLEAAVRQLSITCVFDHLGHAPTHRGLGAGGIQALLRLLETGSVWVKLSGSYRITTEATTPYRDVEPLARALIAANPERVVWGSDWPHPSTAVAMPNDGKLLDMLADWAPEPAVREQILVRNPELLYGFPPL